MFLPFQMMCCLKKQSGRTLWYLGREGWNARAFSACYKPRANPILENLACLFVDFFAFSLLCLSVAYDCLLTWFFMQLCVCMMLAIYALDKFFFFTLFVYVQLGVPTSYKVSLVVLFDSGKIWKHHWQTELTRGFIKFGLGQFCKLSTVVLNVAVAGVLAAALIC